MNIPALATNDDNFLYILSHDLREPARMVNQFLKLVKIKTENQMDKDTEEYLNYAISASKRMDEMIQALHHINKARSYSEEKTQIDSYDLIEKIKNKKSSKIQSRNANISVSGSSIINSRTNLVREILDELITNSLQHAKTTNSLKIQINILQEDENKIKLSVEDNGVRLPELWQERAFEPFKKENKKTKNLGIGLTRLKILINKFDGKINLETLKNGNTYVSCTLS